MSGSSAGRGVGEGRLARWAMKDGRVGDETSAAVVPWRFRRVPPRHSSPGGTRPLLSVDLRSRGVRCYVRPGMMRHKVLGAVSGVF